MIRYLFQEHGISPWVVSRTFQACAGPSSPSTAGFWGIQSVTQSFLIQSRKDFHSALQTFPEAADFYFSPQ